jgi:hypothetical protein
MDGQVRAIVIGIVLFGCATSSVSTGGAQSLSAEEIVIDNTQAEVTGSWTLSTYQPNYYGTNYLFRRSGTGRGPRSLAAHAKIRRIIRRVLPSAERLSRSCT